MVVIELVAEQGKEVTHGAILQAIQQIELIGAKLRWPPCHCPTPDGRDRFLVAGDERSAKAPERPSPRDGEGWSF